MSEDPIPEEDGMPDEAWFPPEDAAPAGVNTKADMLTEDAPGPEVLADLLDRMGSVEELAANLFEELTSYPAGGPWFWEELNPEQRKELWTELDGFVVWLQNRILRHSSNSAGWIPACWYRHPDAVELLTALMVAHKAAYRSKNTKPGFELTEWFTRALWPTMDALARRMTFNACIEGQEHFDASSPGLRLSPASADFTA